MSRNVRIIRVFFDNLLSKEWNISVLNNVHSPSFAIIVFNGVCLFLTNPIHSREWPFNVSILYFSSSSSEYHDVSQSVSLMLTWKFRLNFMFAPSLCALYGRPGLVINKLTRCLFNLSSDGYGALANISSATSIGYRWCMNVSPVSTYPSRLHTLKMFSASAYVYRM